MPAVSSPSTAARHPTRPAVVDPDLAATVLADLQAEHGAMLDIVGAGVLALGTDGRLVSASAAACKTLERSESAFLGRTLDEVFTDAVDEAEQPIASVETALAACAPMPFVFGMRTTAGALRWLKATATALPPDQAAVSGRATQLTFLDITRMKQVGDLLSGEVTKDELTGLLNRAALTGTTEGMLRRAVQSKASLSMLVLDLDGFKRVNDTLGQAAGDELLTLFARRLQHVTREPDVLARRSSDEFVVLLPRCDAKGASRVAQAIHKALDEPFRLEGTEVFVGAAIGAAVCPDHASDAAGLVRCADAAMLMAKREGVNQFMVYSADAQARSTNRLQLETELRYAISRNELTLHYQPRVSARSNRISGVEALVRWNHPDRGMVSPAEFIPAAEESGLIVPLGAWVLREACRQLAEWRSLGHTDITVSVNVAAQQFKSTFLSEVVPAALLESALPASCLELEVTESTIMGNLDSPTLASLAALREQGVQVLLDDFGTGYSSLSYLHKFPLDGLKIDRSFVNRLPESADADGITRAILGMAAALKLATIAEGVENAGQARWLVRNDCSEMQGFLFAKPLPPERLLAVLQQQPVLQAASADGHSYMPSPTPADEAQRLRALSHSGAMAVAKSAALDAVVHTLSKALGVQIALVNLLDEDQVWHKAAVGIDAPSTPRAIAFCGHGVLTDEPLIVPDASADARFSGNPVVAGPASLRFYAGAPLHASDDQGLSRRIGMLCVADRRARDMTLDEVKLLTSFAEMVSRLLEVEGARARKRS